MKSNAEGGLKLLPPQDILQLIQSHEPQDVLLLDLRVFAQYSKSRIHNALNLCIPTTLLKRASYNVQRLAETFANKQDEKAKFNSWRNTQIIITYDAASSNLDEALSCSNIIRKFLNEKWQGAAYILKGGYNAFAKSYPDQVDSRSTDEMEGAHARKLSLDPPSAAPVAGGCAMPPTQHAANPFFGTIRQNMDLIDGVGQISLKRPASLMDSEQASRKLPKWLADASDPKNEGKVSIQTSFSPEVPRVRIADNLRRLRTNFWPLKELNSVECRKLYPPTTGKASGQCSRAIQPKVPPSKWPGLRKAPKTAIKTSFPTTTPAFA